MENRKILDDIASLLGEVERVQSAKLYERVPLSVPVYQEIKPCPPIQSEVQKATPETQPKPDTPSQHSVCVSVSPLLSQTTSQNSATNCDAKTYKLRPRSPLVIGTTRFQKNVIQKPLAAQQTIQAQEPRYSREEMEAVQQQLQEAEAQLQDAKNVIKQHTDAARQLQETREMDKQQLANTEEQLAIQKALVEQLKQRLSQRQNANELVESQMQLQKMGEKYKKAKELYKEAIDSLQRQEEKNKLMETANQTLQKKYTQLVEELTAKLSDAVREASDLRYTAQQKEIGMTELRLQNEELQKQNDAIVSQLRAVVTELRLKDDTKREAGVQCGSNEPQIDCIALPPIICTKVLEQESGVQANPPACFIQQTQTEALATQTCSDTQAQTEEMETKNRRTQTPPDETLPALEKLKVEVREMRQSAAERDACETERSELLEKYFEENQDLKKQITETLDDKQRLARDIQKMKEQLMRQDEVCTKLATAAEMLKADKTRIETQLAEANARLQSFRELAK